jgi:hypothetical protein
VIRGFGEKTALRGKHRTEVTEVTEGDWQSVARSGQDSIAQGLPWVSALPGISPEGAVRYGENRLSTGAHFVFSGPFRANTFF